ncbi:tetraspanin-9 isoform X2 [Simochromis diagramma]|uniref:tetraspanin-9 isoform X2 n=1 Tax=Simochromis diagramma TaxID=43689 RepID=UPI001A7E4A4C|nr:tetraspanin-9 isoform X2 [Simochromis diagramma]XP_042080013.1 tetraspanin-9 isoform X2 [Haplochromis burtoni]
MEKSSSEESAIHRSPSVDSRESDFAQASTSGRPFGGRGFTAGAFYGSTGPRKNTQQGQTGAAADASAGDKTNNKYSSPKGSKYIVFYLDLSFVFLLEFKKCNMARGCLCCLKYMMFIFNLIFWFFIVLLIILLAEVILLILFFVYTDKVRENAKQDLKDGLALYNSENNIGLRNAWNIIQAEWKCCGVIGYTDWHEALKDKVVPDRCCQEHYQNCGRNSTNMFWNRGCFEKVEEWLDDNKYLLGTIGMVILVVELLGMAFSMTLFHHIHRTGKKYDA